MSTSTLFVTGLAISCAMLSGLLFVFSNFAMKAFSQIPSASGVAAMQSINRTILNPGFFSLFFGTASGSLLAAVVALLNWQHPASLWAVAGAALFLAGCIVVTATVNVPLNNRLDAADPTSPQSADLWQRYVARWQPWNHLRTAACLLASACFAVAALHLAAA